MTSKPRSRPGAGRRYPLKISAGNKETFIITMLGLVVVLTQFLPAPSYDSSSLFDGSWQFALTQLLHQGKFLGVDCFYAYGPLAEYFGPIIQAGQKFYFHTAWTEALLASFYAFCFFDFLKHFQKVSLGRRIAFYAGFLVILTLPRFDKLYDHFYDLLIILCYLNYYLEDREAPARNKYLYFLALLSVFLMEFKLSSAVHSLSALFVLLFALAFFRKKYVLAFVVAASVAAADFLFFYLLTGHWNFGEYFSIGCRYMAAYSEGTAFQMIPGSSFYLEGVLLVLGVLAAAGLAAQAQMKDKISQLGFLTSILMSCFLLYKHGFVRPDIHMLFFYFTLLPLLYFLTSLFLLEKGGTALMGLALLLGGLAYLTLDATLRFFGVSTLTFLAQDIHRLADLPGQTARRWGGAGPEPEVTSQLENQYPRLWERLHRMRADYPENSKPTITFSPCEILMTQAVPEYEFAATPSLQINLPRMVPAIDEKDRQFLLSPLAPDLLVLGPGAMDGANSVAQYTDWLEPLIRVYQPAAVLDGKMVLRRRKTTGDESIAVSNQGPGSFLWVQIKPLPFWREFLFESVNAVFKDPEMELQLAALDSKGHLRKIVCRAYYHQLRAGVYLYDKPITDLLLDLQGAQPRFVKILDARLVRSPGLENLPTLPDQMPLEVEFCNVRKQK